MKINVILLQTTKLSFYNKIVKAHFHEEEYYQLSWKKSALNSSRLSGGHERGVL